MVNSRTSSRRKRKKVQLSVRLPSKRVRAEFLIVYELKGCQKAVNFLTEYYSVRKRKIILDGKRVGKNYVGSYEKNRAYFCKEGLTKRIVLHELYHHLVDSKGLELSDRAEEREANSFAKHFVLF
jgi:hypothetical protein